MKNEFNSTDIVQVGKKLHRVEETYTQSIVKILCLKNMGPNSV